MGRRLDHYRLQNADDLPSKVMRAYTIRNELIKRLVLDEGRADILLEHVLGLTLKPFHLRMLDHIMTRSTSLVLAPRGFGKSTVLTVGYCVFRILKNPNIRILIASKTDRQAEKFLREIKEYLQHPKLVEIFGRQIGDKWDTREILVRDRNKIAKEPTMSTVGVAGSVVGGHYDLVVKDDLVDESNSRTETQRKQLLIWYQKVLEPCLEPWADDVTVGTRYHPEDLYGHLIRTQFRKSKKKNYLRVRPVDSEGRSIWPEKFSVGYLKRKRWRIGLVNYMSQYENDTSYMEGDFFKTDDILFYDNQPAGLQIYQGVDLAIRESERSSYFCIVTIGVDPKTDDVYVLHYYKNRISLFNQFDKITEEYERFDPILAGIEANGYQAAVSDTILKQSDMRVVPIVTLKDKETRAHKFSVLLEQHKLFVKRGMAKLVEDLVAFPSRTDLFDALDIAYTTSRRKSRRWRHREDEPGLL